MQALSLSAACVVIWYIMHRLQETLAITVNGIDVRNVLITGVCSSDCLLPVIARCPDSEVHVMAYMPRPGQHIHVLWNLYSES